MRCCMKSAPLGWRAVLFLTAILFVVGCERSDPLTGPKAKLTFNTASTTLASGAPFAYVTNFSSNMVSVIATATNTVVATVAVGTCPLGVAITPDGAFAYVANAGSSTVSVIATATNTVVATVAVGAGPEGVAITPDGAFAYVTNFASNTVSVIATATNTVVATIGVGAFPSGVAITPDGAFAYVTNEYSNTVSVIATATNTVVATILGFQGRYDVAITPQLGSPLPTTAADCRNDGWRSLARADGSSFKNQGDCIRF